MTFEDAKQFAINQEPSFLTRAKNIGGQKSYVCPCCNNGTKNKKTGITMLPKSYDHPLYHCFSCGLTADIFDLAKEYYGVSNNKDAFQAVYDYFGIKIDDVPSHEPIVRKVVKDIPKEVQETPMVDYMEYISRAAYHLDPTYLMNRGISEKTQKHYMIGTDPKWLNPITVERFKKEGKNLRSLVPSPRCIIPTSRYSYLARDIRDNLTETQQNYAKQKVGKVPLFNEKFASKSPIIFVSEGEIDAISFNEVTDGEIEAAGLGSTSNWSKFIARCSTGGPFYGKPVVLALDNDEPGKKASALMKAELEKKDVIVVELNYEGKDPNSALVKNRYAFKKSVTETISLVKSLVKERAEKDNHVECDLEM